MSGFGFRFFFHFIYPVAAEAVGMWETCGVFCRKFSKLLRETASFAVFLGSGISTAFLML